MENKNLVIEYVGIDSLKGWEKNPRVNDDAAAKLANLITEHGFIDPIIATRDGVIRAGHTRAKAAKIKGMDKVPVIFVEFKTEKHAEAFSLADNKAGEWADWDYKMLANILLDLDTGEIDMDITGFNIDEIEDLMTEYGDEKVKEEEDFDFDKEVENIDVPYSETNDIWILGKHRLVCGDCTKEEVVKVLMDGNRADMCFTDPPYNVNYEGSSGMKIENDNMAEAAFEEFLTNSFINIFNSIKEGGPFYVCHSGIKIINFVNAIRKSGLLHKQTLIWVKNALVMGHSDYQYKHEPIIYGWKPGAAHKWYGFRDKTTVYDDDIDLTKLKKVELIDMLKELLNNINSTILRENKPSKNDIHPTMKPLAVVRHYIKNSSRKKGIVLDLFLGSGSTLIASEQLERVCYGTEIDPIYADAIVKRYIKFKNSRDGIVLIRGGKEISANDIEEFGE